MVTPRLMAGWSVKEASITYAGAAAVAAAVISLAAVALRLITVVDVPINWDAAQFVLAVRDYDVSRHQPHPPGYPLYVLTGWAVSSITGDPSQAFSLTSAVGGGLSVWLLFVVGRAVATPGLGLAAAILLATSPLAWYYGSVGLSYAPESALATLVALLVWRARAQRQERAALWSAVALSTAGGVRQSTLLLLLPLWLYGLMGHRRSVVLRASLLLCVGCLAWFLPLLWLSGGLERYLHASRRLALLAAESSSVVSNGPEALRSNVAFVAAGMLIGLGLGLAALAANPSRWLRTVRRRPELPAFLALWTLPALAVFVTLHIGQQGYLLIVLPALCLLLADALRHLGQSVAAACGAPATRGAFAAVTLAAVANLVIFLATPNALTAGALVEERHFWRRLSALLSNRPPHNTAILTGGRQAESFRQAMVELPDYSVYAIGADRTGGVGVLFSAVEGHADYDAYLDGRPADPMLVLPATTRHIVVLDASAIDVVQRLLPLVPASETSARPVLLHHAEHPIPPLDFQAATKPPTARRSRAPSSLAEEGVLQVEGPNFRNCSSSPTISSMVHP